MTKPELPPGPWSHNADNGQAIKDANGAILAYVLIRVSDECGPIFAAAQAALEVCEDVRNACIGGTVTEATWDKAIATLEAAYPDPPKSLVRRMAERLQFWIDSSKLYDPVEDRKLVAEARAAGLLEDK